MDQRDRHAIDRIARHIVSGEGMLDPGDEALVRLITARIRNKLEAVGASASRRLPRSRKLPRASRATDPRLIALIITRVDKLLANTAQSRDGRAHAR